MEPTRSILVCEEDGEPNPRGGFESGVVAPAAVAADSARRHVPARRPRTLVARTVSTGGHATSGFSSMPLAVDGYIRVSKVGGRASKRLISPALQREQIHAWARARGVRVLEVGHKPCGSSRRDHPRRHLGPVADRL